MEFKSVKGRKTGKIDIFDTQKIDTQKIKKICVLTCFHMRIPKPCLSVRTRMSVRTPSVCLYPEKRNHLIFINISPTLVIDTSMERSSRVLQHGNPKI